MTQPHGSSSTIATERLGAVAVVHVRGEIDLTSEAAFIEAVRAAAAAASRIAVDLSECKYLDSSTVGALVRMKREFAGAMRIVVPIGAPIRRVFEITNLVDRLELESTLEG
jgi:anti-anti-sigma factor